MTHIPPRSPHGLIQEDLWPNEWAILVACILLNCTTRRAIEVVFRELMMQYPDAEQMAKADHGELSLLIGRLGFGNRRAKRLIDMSRAYVRGGWSHASELPGIGEYASAAWEMFVVGKMPKECPRDGALTAYYRWRMKNDG